MFKRYSIEPVGKPRMTRRDTWKKRPATDKYWKFKDEVKRLNVNVEECNQKIIFHIPMPKSWSKKKKNLYNGKPHKQKPDVDNLLKALLDAIYDDDSHIWDIRAVKVWSTRGEIVIQYQE